MHTEILLSARYGTLILLASIIKPDDDYAQAIEDKEWISEIENIAGECVRV